MSCLWGSLGALNDLLDPRKLCRTTPLDGISAVRHFDVQQLSIEKRLLTQCIIDSLKQRIVIRNLRCHERYNRNAEALLNFLRIDTFTLLLSNVHEIEYQYTRHVRSNTGKVSQHIQATLKLGSISHHKGYVSHSRRHKIRSYLFFGRIRCESISTRQVNNLICRITATKFAFFAFNRLSRPIAHMLTRPRESIKQG